jgi:hypothetical protein
MQRSCNIDQEFLSVKPGIGQQTLIATGWNKRYAFLQGIERRLYFSENDEEHAELRQ